MIKIINAFLVIIFFSTISCDRHQSISINEENQNGQIVKVISNPVKGLYEKQNKKIPKIYLTDNPIKFENLSDSTKIVWKISDIFVDKNKNIYVADPRQGAVLKFDSLGSFIYKVGSLGRGPGEFTNLRDVCVTDENKVLALDEDGKVEIFDGSTGKGLFGFRVKENAFSMAANNNYIYVMAVGNFEKPYLLKYNYSGELITQLGWEIEVNDDEEFNFNNFKPFSLALDKNNNLYAANYFQPYLIEKYSKNEQKLFETTRKLPYKLDQFGKLGTDGKFSPGNVMCGDIEISDAGLIFVIVGGGYGKKQNQSSGVIESPYEQHIDVFDPDGIFLYSMWNDSIPGSMMGYQLCFFDSDKLFISDGVSGYNELLKISYEE